MKKSRVSAFFLSFLFLLPCLMPTTPAADELNESDAPAPPASVEIEAKAALVTDMSSGITLLEMQADDSLYPASTTKIMTAYLVMKYGNIYDSVEITDAASTGIDADASSVALKTGEYLSVYELLECLLIASANDAANALAVYVSGSIPDFVELMNQEAEALGCTGTHFANPNGLHDENHYTTARDLALIASAAMQFDVIRQLVSTVSAEIPATNLSDARELITTNYLLPGSDKPAYAYSGAIGIKTGFTTPAGYCLISAAEKDGITLLSVILGAEAYTDGDEERIGSFTETAKLLDWGFANYERAVLSPLVLEPTTAPEETSASESLPEEQSSFEETIEGDSSLENEVSAVEETAAAVSFSSLPSPSSAEAAAPLTSAQSDVPTWLANLADRGGITPEILLLGVIGITLAVAFLLLIVLIIRIRRHSSKRR